MWTTNGICHSGTCQGCPVPTDDCTTAGTFDTVTQQCSAPTVKADGTTCDSENTNKCDTILEHNLFPRNPMNQLMWTVVQLSGATTATRRRRITSVSRGHARGARSLQPHAIPARGTCQSASAPQHRPRTELHVAPEARASRAYAQVRVAVEHMATSPRIPSSSISFSVNLHMKLCHSGRPLCIRHPYALGLMDRLLTSHDDHDRHCYGHELVRVGLRRLDHRWHGLAV